MVLVLGFGSTRRPGVRLSLRCTVAQSARRVWAGATRGGKVAAWSVAGVRRPGRPSAGVLPRACNGPAQPTSLVASSPCSEPPAVPLLPAGVRVTWARPASSDQRPRPAGTGPSAGPPKPERLKSCVADRQTPTMARSVRPVVAEVASVACCACEVQPPSSRRRSSTPCSRPARAGSVPAAEVVCPLTGRGGIDSWSRPPVGACVRRQHTQAATRWNGRTQERSNPRTREPQNVLRAGRVARGLRRGRVRTARETVGVARRAGSTCRRPTPRASTTIVPVVRVARMTANRQPPTVGRLSTQSSPSSKHDAAPRQLAVAAARGAGSRDWRGRRREELGWASRSPSRSRTGASRRTHQLADEVDPGDARERAGREARVPVLLASFEQGCRLGQMPESRSSGLMIPYRNARATACVFDDTLSLK